MKQEVLYPECDVCGACDGISTAVVGPESPDGMHDIERYGLACGHDMRPEAQISSGIVEMLKIEDPSTIEVRSGFSGEVSQ